MRLTKDLLSGVMFSVFGLGAAIIASGYGFGSPVRMGPGFFPIVVGVLLAAMGLALIVQSLRHPETDAPVERLHFRPLIFISAAIASFGILIEERGLIVALVALIVIARFAGREGSLLELAVMVVVLIAVAVGIFVYALNIYLRLWI
jgi:phosphate/sulfate permease